MFSGNNIKTYLVKKDNMPAGLLLESHREHVEPTKGYEIRRADILRHDFEENDLRFNFLRVK